MKKVVFLIALIAVVYYHFGATQYPLPGDKAKKLKTVDYARFVKDGPLALTNLAVEGQNTIIEVYAPSCPACKQFETMIPKMQKLRPDVNFQQVDITDGFLRGTLSKKVKVAKREDGICSTPHLVIIDTKGEVVVTDTCDSKEAYKYFYKWLNAENKKSYKDKMKKYKENN